MHTNNKFLDLKDFQIVQSIGSGAFSNVYRVKKKTGEYYAAKISLFMVDEDTQSNAESLSLFREVNLLSLLDHPSILKFIGYSQVDFEGEMNPTIITEYAINGSLESVIEMERLGLSPKEWDYTKKLISIYGIATGMSYMHLHNVIHRDLKPENILMDEYLHPKISDFGLSKITDILSISMNMQSQKGTKGTPAYMAPEVLTNEEYSKASDVYSFAFIVFEIVTLERPMMDFNSIYKLINMICKGYRPKIPDDVPVCYRELIERCWSQEPENRPSFDEIVQEIKNGDGFMHSLVDESELFDYFDFIDSSNCSFDVSNRLVHFQDFIKKQGRIKNIKKISLMNEAKNSNENVTNEDKNSNEKVTNEDKNSNENITNEDKNSNENITNEDKNSNENITNEDKNSNEKVTNEDKNSNEKVTNEDKNSNEKVINEDKNANEIIFETIKHQNLQKSIIRNDLIQENQLLENSDDETKTPIDSDDKSLIENDTYKFLYSNYFLFELDPISKKIFLETSNNPFNFFITAKSLINGENKFPIHFNIGKAYLFESISKGCIEANLYYAELLLKGVLFIQNIDKSKEILKKYQKTENAKGQYYQFLMGKLYKKEKKYSKAMKSFEKSAKNGNAKSMYEIGKFWFIGRGCIRNHKKSFAYFEMSAKNGFKKSESFISVYKQLNQFKDFQKLDQETKIFFITNSFKNDQNNFDNNIVQFNQIFIQSNKIEMLYYNNSFKSSYFYSFLSNYKEILVNLDHNMSSFNDIYDLISKIKNDKIKQIDIGIGLSFYSINDAYTNISRFYISQNIDAIYEDSFKCCPLLTQIIFPPMITTIDKFSFADCMNLTHITIPNSVTTIGQFSFNSCISLEQITFVLPSSVTKIEMYAFSNCRSLKEIAIPSSVYEIGNRIISNGQSLTAISFQFPSIITSLYDNYFNEEFLSLKKVELPYFLKTIPSMHFYRCKTLEKVLIYSRLKSIEPFAFFGCSSLKSITIPSSVTLIGDRAFSECTLLTKLKIPSSVLYIGESAFNGCIALKQIIISSSVTYIGDHAFEKCSSLIEVEIPSSINSIGNYLFNECSSLIDVVIPSSVRSIGDFAFNECKSLKKIIIPSSVKSFGCYVFDGCSSLEKMPNISPSDNKRVKIIE